MPYLRVADDGTTSGPAQQPPRSMRLKDGRSVSGRTANPDRLAMGGWVEATDDPPDYDPNFQRLVGPMWQVTIDAHVNTDGDGETYDVPIAAVADYGIETRSPYLTVDKSSIVADDSDTATVIFRDGASSAPDEVTFIVNDQEVGPVSVDDGEATVSVSTTTAGTIEVGVDVDGVSPVTIKAIEED